MRLVDFPAADTDCAAIVVSVSLLTVGAPTQATASLGEVSALDE